jgi:hypothetical protein
MSALLGRSLSLAMATDLQQQLQALGSTYRAISAGGMSTVFAAAETSLGVIR